MTEKFSGIVLRTRKYNDTLMIADIYTAERGRMSFLVPVTHSKRSKVRNVLFQPLSMLSFTSSVKAGRGLSRIGEAVPLTLYCSITGDVVKSSIALYIAELLSYALREDVKDEALYTFLDRSLTLLDNLADGYYYLKNVPAVQMKRVGSLGWEDPLEMGMATHSRFLAWRIPRTGEPGGLQAMGLQRIRHDLVTKQQQQRRLK